MRSARRHGALRAMRHAKAQEADASARRHVATGYSSDAFVILSFFFYSRAATLTDAYACLRVSLPPVATIAATLLRGFSAD